MKQWEYRVHAAAFDPRWYQEEFLAAMQAHTPENPARGMAVWPRRSGKDLTALHNTLVLAHDKVGMYWHCLPVYEQARKACWNAFRTDRGQRLMDNVFPVEIRKSPKEFTPGSQMMLVELKGGSIVQFVGSDSIDRLVGAGLAGCNFSEFALSKPTAWPLIQPIMRESRGWVSFLFTPRSRNHAHKLFLEYKKDPDRFCSYKTLYDLMDKAAARAILDEARREGMPEELVRQEYLCDFSAALIGSYYGDLLERTERDGRICDFDHERDGVFTFWDLGISDSTAIWLVRLNGQNGVDFIHHYQANGRAMSHYFQWIRDQAEEHRFEYAGHFFPHDARARELGTGANIIQLAATEFGVAKCHIVPDVGFLNGIQAARRLLEHPVRFHTRCDKYFDKNLDRDVETNGIEALRQYHKAWDEETKSYGLHAEHDWTSHSADAFRYTAVGLEQARIFVPKKPKLVTQASIEEQRTLQRLWETAPKAGRRRV